MQKEIEKYVNTQKFGKLELVDREIFYISFNTRDNQIKLDSTPCIESNTPITSSPKSIKKKTIITSKTFIANLISFQTITTAIIKIKNIAHNGSVAPNRVTETTSISFKPKNNIVNVSYNSF